MEPHLQDYGDVLVIVWRACGEFGGSKLIIFDRESQLRWCLSMSKVLLILRKWKSNHRSRVYFMGFCVEIKVGFLIGLFKDYDFEVTGAFMLGNFSRFR